MSSNNPVDESVKSRILISAKKEFFQKGFDGARMQEIADKAGINKAMLHYYFINKENLFREIFLEGFKNLTPRLIEIIQSELPFFDKIRKLMFAHIDLLSKNPDLPLFINSELAKGNLKIKEIFLHSVQNSAFFELAKLIEIEVREKRIKPIEPLNLIVNILAMNVFPFISKNILTLVLPLDPFQYEIMIEKRKNEAAEFIINAIKI